MFNMSANGWGEPDARAQAVRELNRNLDFRKAVTYAMDRQRLGDSLVRGPFTAIYPGGLLPSSTFYDAASTVYFPFSAESARASLAAAGLTDTDGNGFVNLPGGGDLNVTLLTNADYATDRSLAEGVIAMMGDVGVQVTLNSLPGKDYDNARQTGGFDWLVRRADAWFVSATQNTLNLAPVGPETSDQHRANAAGEIELLPFEEEMVAAIQTFVNSSDPAVRVQALKDYQRIFTENVNAVGLTVFAGALIINKRFSNVPEGTPIRLYNWAEDSIMRERLFTAAEAQLPQLYPETLPGAPGAAGPITAD
jgi:peptide/nickel transport system substrate-binding protein